MTTLKVIFDFILSVVKIIFPGKDSGRHCRKDHPVPHHHSPALADPEGDGGSPGSCGGDPVGSSTADTATADTADTDTAPTADTASADASERDTADTRLMGHALIATAIIGYLYKMVAEGVAQ